MQLVALDPPATIARTPGSPPQKVTFDCDLVVLKIKTVKINVHDDHIDVTDRPTSGEEAEGNRHGR
jgi:hypothetical protein